MIDRKHMDASVNLGESARRLQHNASRPVEQLAEALGALDLCKAKAGLDHEQEAAGVSQDRPNSRQGCGKENANAGASLTPSRLACFQQLRDELTCAVCLDICVRPCTTPCGHNYCRSCLRRNLELNRPCPKCRTTFPPGYALNINTTLWNTIQHLFPSEASGKPLTPPPPQPAAARSAQALRQTATANLSSVTAPFRPPRFTAPAEPSHSNSAAALQPQGRALGLTSQSGRSVSGPRPNLQLSASSFYPTTAEPSSSGAAVSSSRSVGVVSLAELGTRPAQGGSRAQRDRRRSRSAERWEVGPLRPPEENTTRRSSGTTSLSARAPVAASSSRLMELLTDRPPRIPPAASGNITSHWQRTYIAPQGETAPGGGQPAAAASAVLNPFLRAPRPAVAASSTNRVNTSAGSMQDNTVPPGRPRNAAVSVGNASADLPVSVFASASGFSASQRALLDARLYIRTGLSGREQAVPQGARSSAGVSATSSCASRGSNSSVGTSSSHSSSVFGTLDDASALELLPEEQLPGSGPVLPSRSDTAPSGAHAATALHDLTERSGATRAGVLLPGDASDEVLDDLDTPVGTTSPLVRAPVASPTASDVPSPTWEELDSIMARALEPLRLSPPDLPRLRVPGRQAAATASVNILSATGAAVRHVTDTVGPYMDPDSATNYDGEDPSGTDSFFTSPFFDETLLQDAIRDGENNSGSEHDGAGSVFPSHSSERSTFEGRLETVGEQELPSLNSSSEPHGRTTRPVAASYVGRPSGSRTGSHGHGNAQGVSEDVGQNGLVRAGGAPQAGDRDCPIELLSDSDDETGQDVHARVPLMRQAPVRQGAGRVVPGLRRPK